jgi:hypothetical protein
MMVYAVGSAVLFALYLVVVARLLVFILWDR